MKASLVLATAALLLTALTLSGAEPTSEKKKPDVGYYATTQDVVEEILKQAKVTKKDVVIDLGCGDGRFPITAAKKYGCKGIGYEIDPVWVAKAKARVEAEMVTDLVDIRAEDIFTADLRKVTVVCLFLLPELNTRLIPQLEKLPEGARIVTHEFDIPGLVPDRKTEYISTQDESEHLLYFYSVPLKRAPVGKRAAE
ncbi:MAG: 50S ribosomal protein L11 methyltransferase [Planctomycetaceae bacterium]|nr:50S ribosomal protein L11 methyltransferase [Planctomycetaceae bacterium]